MAPNERPATFWLDKWDGVAEGGLIVRSDLNEFFKLLDDKGIKAVGLKVNNSFDLEIIVEKKI